jgi:NAD(P)H-flavin reductase
LDFVGTDDTTCFLCGKPEMVDEVREKLADAGVSKEQIVFEKY